jgi:EamA domain-containing membrane protein RarD
MQIFGLFTQFLWGSLVLLVDFSTTLQTIIQIEVCSWVRIWTICNSILAFFMLLQFMLVASTKPTRTPNVDV